jgi:glycosyltransferase involved in cell wall biosynthesis
MRVLFFSRDYTTHDRRFLQKLSESRHEIFFLRLESDGVKYEERTLPENVRAVSWQDGLGRAATLEARLALMPAFETVLESVKPDLVHAGLVQSCGFMTALTGFRPFVLMSWGSDVLLDANRNDLWRWMTCYALKRADIFVCDCQAVQDKAKELTGYSDDRIVQFPWGVDPSFYVSGKDAIRLRNRPGWEDAFVVLSTRSWEPIYGIDVLLDAFRKSVAQNPRFRLILLGEGSLSSSIDRFISEYGLNNLVHRPGVISQEQLPNYFRAADLYVSCSLSDGSSVSLLEAMATGLPVIVTEAPGNREWVETSENGWLAPPGDADAFKQAMLDAAEMSLSSRKRMAMANRRLIEQRADWNVNFGKLLAAYDYLEAQFRSQSRQ